MSTEPTQPGPGRPALRGGTASEHIHLRATGHRKSHYVRHAKKRGQTLADWAFETLDAASQYSPPIEPTTSPQPAMEYIYRPKIIVAQDFARVHVPENYRPTAEAKAAELNKAFVNCLYKTTASAIGHADAVIKRAAAGVTLLPGYERI